MNNQTPFDDTSNSARSAKKGEAGLARWLQQVLTTPDAAPIVPPFTREDEQNDVQLSPDYHPHFYQQLPNFIKALLSQEPHVALQYAPLVFHLIGCSSCHSAYLELYDALRFAYQPQETRLLVGQGSRTLAGLPPRMVVNFCQLLISQAEAVLREEDEDATELARSLLLQAMQSSSYMAQPGMRSRALKDLVRVATLVSGTESPSEEPQGHTYSLQASGSGGSLRHARTVRKVETSSRPQMTSKGEPAIYLQSQQLGGKIIQRGQQLVLQLQNLESELYGRLLWISVPLGALLEPVRWLGGNPLQIQSVAAVGVDGVLETPLGSTELLLTNHEDRNLLEAMFLLLKIRPVQE